MVSHIAILLAFLSKDFSLKLEGNYLLTREIYNPSRYAN